MADSIPVRLLRQKIEFASARAVRAALRADMLEDIATSLSKVFLDHLGMNVETDIVSSRVGSGVAIIDRLSSDLFAQLVLPGGAGLACFNDDFIEVAVSSLGGGRRDTRKTGETRPLTPTDAALAGYVIDAFLSGVFVDHYPETGPYQLGVRKFYNEKAPLAYLLDDTQYALLTIEVGFTGGNRSGFLELMVPLGCISTQGRNADDATSQHDNKSDVWKAHMSSLANQIPLHVKTVVQRMPMSLREVFALKAGNILALPNASVQHITLEADSKSGPQVIGEGQLGALNTFKAFKARRLFPDLES